MTNKKEIMSVKEFVWYCIGSVIAIFGIILMIFGIIGTHLNTPVSHNFIKSAEQQLMDATHIPFDFRTWGVMFVLLGVIVLIISLCAFARKADRDNERTVRRQQRLAAASADLAGVKSAVEVVEEAPAPAPEAEPVNENK